METQSSLDRQRTGTAFRCNGKGLGTSLAAKAPQQPPQLRRDRKSRHRVALESKRAAGAFPVPRYVRSELWRRHLKEEIMSEKMGGSPTAAAVAVRASTVVHDHHDASQSAVLSGEEATQGIKLGHMRYVLGIGLALAVIAGVIVAALFAR
jgi:hypothetical protein